MRMGLGLRRVVSSTCGRRQAGADANKCGQCQKIPIQEEIRAAAQSASLITNIQDRNVPKLTNATFTMV